MGAVVPLAATDLGLWAGGEAHSVQTRRVAARTAPAEEGEMDNITLVSNPCFIVDISYYYHLSSSESSSLPW